MGAEGKFDLKLAPSYEASLGSASSPPSASSRSMFTSPKSGMNELFLAGFFAILASFWHFLATFVFHLQDKKMFYHFGWFLKLSASFWQLLFFLSLLMFSQHFGTFRPSLAIYEDFCYSYGSSISDTVTSTKTSNSSKAPKVSASRKASSTSSLPEATTDGKSESRNHLT